MNGKPVLLGYGVNNAELVHLAYPERWLGTYIIGMAGMGKTSALLNLVMWDMASGHGLCVIDPQGNWIADILARVPPEREQDLIYFSPAEREHPLGLHLFECDDPDNDDLVDLIVSQVMYGVFEEIWGDMDEMPRLADVLRHTLRTMVRCQSLPDERMRPTLIELPRLLRNDEYRQSLLAHIRGRYLPKEAELDEWWRGYEAKGSYQRDEQTASTLNKVERFTQNAMVKRIIGQNKTTINFRQAMDEGKIILVDLSEGVVGREAQALIGTLVISRIYLAAKSRVDLLTQGYAPRRFHLLVDEFQNFATFAFSKLQDECRQYGVDITIAHQNRMGQLAGETQVQASTLGMTNWMVLRTNPADAAMLATGFSTTPPEAKERLKRRPLVYASKPWDVLKSDGHEDKLIMHNVYLISRYLTIGPYFFERDGFTIRGPFYYAEEERKKGLPVLWAFPREGERDSFVAGLNSYLYESMSGGRYAEERLEPMLHRLCDQLFCWRYVEYWPWPGDIYDQIRRDFQPATKWERLSDPSMEVFKLVGVDQWFRNLESEIMEQETTSDTRRLNELKGRHARMFARWLIATDISGLGITLQAQPLWASGGQPVTEYEPPRTFADVAKERENQIVHLPRYEALVRIQEEGGTFREAHIRTAHAKELWTPRAINPTERIKEASRQKHGRDIAEVEQEQAARLRSPTSTSTTLRGQEEGIPIFEVLEEGDDIKPWNVLE